MLHINGEMVSYGDGGLRLFYYATETFSDFTLRLQFKIFETAKHNSGVFVRFPRPTLDLATAELNRRAANEPAFDPGNPAWKPVIAGFEVQVDDNAIGDGTKDFYGIRPEHLTINQGGAQAEVMLIEPTGAETQISVDMGGATIVATVRDRLALRAGDTISIAADPSKVHLFDVVSGRTLIV